MSNISFKTKDLNKYVPLEMVLCVFGFIRLQIEKKYLINIPQMIMYLTVAYYAFQDWFGEITSDFQRIDRHQVIKRKDLNECKSLHGYPLILCKSVLNVKWFNKITYIIGITGDGDEWQIRWDHVNFLMVRVDTDDAGIEDVHVSDLDVRISANGSWIRYVKKKFQGYVHEDFEPDLMKITIDLNKKTMQLNCNNSEWIHADHPISINIHHNEIYRFGISVFKKNDCVTLRGVHIE